MEHAAKLIGRGRWVGVGSASEALCSDSSFPEILSLNFFHFGDGQMKEPLSPDEIVARASVFTWLAIDMSENNHLQ